MAVKRRALRFDELKHNMLARDENGSLVRITEARDPHNVWCTYPGMSKGNFSISCVVEGCSHNTPLFALEKY